MSHGYAVNQGLQRLQLLDGKVKQLLVDQPPNAMCHLFDLSELELEHFLLEMIVHSQARNKAAFHVTLKLALKTDDLRSNNPLLRPLLLLKAHRPAMVAVVVQPESVPLVSQSCLSCLVNICSENN